MWGAGITGAGDRVSPTDQEDPCAAAPTSPDPSPSRPSSAPAWCSAGAGHDLVEGSKVALSFEDGRISANAGCNTMNGAATWDGDTLQVAGPLAMTMMACDEALMDQDQWLSEFLTSSPALAVDGETLTLGDDTTGITLSEN